MTEDRYKQLRGGSIRQRLQFVVKDSALYGGAAAVSKLLNLLILPVLTRLFSNAEYGALDAMTVLGAIFVSFMIMGQDSAMARYFYEYEDEPTKRRIISEAMAIELLVFVVVIPIAWFGAEWILAAMYGIGDYVDYFRIMVLSFPFVLLTRFTSNLFKWTFARWQFILTSMGASAFVIALTLVFVLPLDMGIRGVFTAQVIGYGISAVVGMWLARRHFVVPRGFRFGARLLRYGVPYMVVGVASCLIPAIDRVFITRQMGLDSAGVYAIGYRYAFMLMLPITAFTTAWTPFSLSIYREDTAQETYDRGLTLMTAGLCMLSITMVAVAEPVITLVASARFRDGYVVALPLLLAFIMQAISQVVGIGISLSKRTQFLVWSYSIGILGSIVFIRLLIEPLGMLGVGLGVLLGQTTQAAAYIAFSYYVYPLRFGWRRPAALLLVTGLGGAAMQLVPLPLLPLVALRAAILVVVFVLFWLVIFDAGEREKAVALVRGYLGR